MGTVKKQKEAASLFIFAILKITSFQFRTMQKSASNYFSYQYSIILRQL